MRSIGQFSDVELKAIKNRKDSIYPKYLEYTFLNQRLFALIFKYFQRNKIILLTNASESRTILLLKYYQIDKYFAHIFCNQSGNKFVNCIKSLELNPNNMLVFEYETLQVQCALCASILKDRIIQIKELINLFEDNIPEGAKEAIKERDKDSTSNS